MDYGRSRTKERKRSSGSVLVFVLAMVVLLSVLAMRLMNETMREIQHLSQFHRRDALRVHAYSALEIGIGVLAEWREIKKQLYAPGQGWGNPLEYAEIKSPEGISWKVKFEVENGKIPMSQL